jgi:hypothetical protein
MNRVPMRAKISEHPILAKMRSQMQIILNRFTISLEQMKRSSIVDLAEEDSVICDIHRA